MPGILCIVCKSDILVMAFKGTLVCSDLCRKRLVEMTKAQEAAETFIAPISKENN